MEHTLDKCEWALCVVPPGDVLLRREVKRYSKHIFFNFEIGTQDDCRLRLRILMAEGRGWLSVEDKRILKLAKDLWLYRVGFLRSVLWVSLFSLRHQSLSFPNPSPKWLVVPWFLETKPYICSCYKCRILREIKYDFFNNETFYFRNTN